MIGSSRALRVFAYAAPCDMRKGYDGLEAIVRNELSRDITSGELYLFTNARRRRAKVLLFDGTGLAIYMKRAYQRMQVRRIAGGALEHDPHPSRDHGGPELCCKAASIDLSTLVVSTRRQPDQVASPATVHGLTFCRGFSTNHQGGQDTLLEARPGRVWS